MTRHYSFSQQPDAQFLAQANTIGEQCEKNRENWLLDDDFMQSFTTYLKIANEAYKANSDIALKNSVTAALKKSAFSNLKHNMSTFITYLEINQNVPDMAIEFMGLRPRKRQNYQPLPRPTTIPEISTVKRNDEITIYVSQPEHDQPKSGLAPVDQYHGFMIRYRLEGDVSEQIVAVTRLHHTLFFEREDEGKHLTLSVAWINPRLEIGPWSKERTEIIG
jgi:hypothetical protein